jgi:hypothetical protein
MTTAERGSASGLEPKSRRTPMSIGRDTMARVQSRFTSPLHDERIAAWLGIALGVCFATAFITGLYSHFAQHPPSWFELPARPAGLYRITQGIHVATGIASIPLLLAKLWVVFPKLFHWPPFESVAHFVERVFLFPLVAGSLFLLVSGLANINLWYPWAFAFPKAHYWAAWITIGALVAHIGAKWSITRSVISRRPARLPVDDAPETARVPAVIGAAHVAALADRRRFLATVFGVSGIVTLFTLGETVSPLSKLALLSPRRPNVGPQGFPVNRTAYSARVRRTAVSPDFRLIVEGKVSRPLSLSIDEVRSLPQHSATLPIACACAICSRWSAPRLMPPCTCNRWSRSVAMRARTSTPSRPTTPTPCSRCS